ncbi:hypothetical protein V6N11_003601 [Hibiscus sabdariffa]|uniref:Uncharacterized protein n=1 Tax=Hibiscus sabdariffa TaxID=183260 RepID=A0ABR2SDP5_9ROSI
MKLKEQTGGGPRAKREGRQPRFMSQETNATYQIYMYMKTSVVAAGEVEKQKELTVEADKKENKEIENKNSKTKKITQIPNDRELSTDEWFYHLCNVKGGVTPALRFTAISTALEEWQEIGPIVRLQRKKPTQGIECELGWDRQDAMN